MIELPRRGVITAPAKINLGLEIIGRRLDGYHEIRSILAMLELSDTLTVRVDTRTSRATEVSGVDLDPEENLIAKAAHLFGTPASVDVKKLIPIAAGLGGASADAAATLFAMNALLDVSRPSADLKALASAIGSDVPFFLGEACAEVSGRGTELAPLPPPKGWVILATPDITIPGKTGTLYGHLIPDDFSTGAAIREQAERLRASSGIDEGLLGNTFTRALSCLYPGIEELRNRMHEAGCPFVALSGAGPTHYSLVQDRDRAESIAARLRAHLTSHAKVFVTRFRQTRLHLLSTTDAVE